MAFSPGAVVSSIRRIFLVIGVSALAGILMAGLALPVVGALGLGARESSDWFQDLDLDFEAGELSETSRIVDSNNKLVATFFNENRHYVELDDVSEVMIDAILAIEDDRFFERGPIDFQGTMRALMRNVEAGETQGGGSTLTQQYVKLVRLSQAETSEERAQVLASEGVEGYKRKLEELRMAISVEQELTKEEILERYLNIAYFGSRAYGIEAAARTYFSTNADELTVTQAALLAGIVQSPNQYDPNRNPEAALGRRNVVLGRMAETGKISQEEAAEARQTDLDLDPRDISNGCVDSSAGFFCDYVVNEIRKMEELGETPEEREHALYNGGLRIKTTLDRDVQRAADKAVSDRVAPTDEAIASLAAVEPGTGYIQAIANSRKYGVEGNGVSNINYAVDRDMGGGDGMQPGSSFKTWVLAAAISQGISLSETINSPGQISLAENTFTTCEGRYTNTGQVWSPKNYDSSSGTIDMRTATERSVNTYFAQLAQRTGLCDPATIAEKSGVVQAGNGEGLRQVPSFPLGVNEVSPLAMAGGYAMFANRGRFCEPIAVLEVKDRDGNVIVDNSEPDCKRVVEKPVADAVNSVLEGVIHNPGGTGGRMQLEDGRRAAGKTGTTNDAMAVWFVGYTPQIATAVAVSDVDPPRSTLHGLTYNGEVIANACGGCIPGPIWKQFMDAALEGEPKETFKEPDGKIIQGVTMTVPDVRGMDSNQALQALQDAGFNTSVEEINSDLPQGRVARTDPGAGSQVPSGTNIRVYVSNGEPPRQDDDDDDGWGNGDGDDDGGRFRIPEEPRPPGPPRDGDNSDNGDSSGEDGEDEDNAEDWG